MHNRNWRRCCYDFQVSSQNVTRRLSTRTAHIFRISHLQTRIWEQTNHFHQHIPSTFLEYGHIFPRISCVAWIFHFITIRNRHKWRLQNTRRHRLHKFCNFLDSILTPFALAQHVHFPTHDEGLDLIVTRSDSTLVQDISHYDPGLSDHEAISFKFCFPVRKPATRTRIHFRPWKELDIPAFKNAILTSPLYTNPADNASELAIQMTSTLTDILDNQIPIKSKLIVQRPPKPWINPDILESKREHSQLERRWRQSRLPSDRRRLSLSM